jgi:hypothetical protein
VMLVSGPRWHVMSLHGGVMRSGDVIGHTRATAPALAEETAREILMRTVGEAGFTVMPAW